MPVSQRIAKMQKMSSQFASDCAIGEGNNMRAELAERGLER